MCELVQRPKRWRRCSTSTRSSSIPTNINPTPAESSAYSGNTGSYSRRACTAKLLHVEKGRVRHRRPLNARRALHEGALTTNSDESTEDGLGGIGAGDEEGERIGAGGVCGEEGWSVRSEEDVGLSGGLCTGKEGTEGGGSG